MYTYVKSKLYKRRKVLDLYIVLGSGYGLPTVLLSNKLYVGISSNITVFTFNNSCRVPAL